MRQIRTLSYFQMNLNTEFSNEEKALIISINYCLQASYCVLISKTKRINQTFFRQLYVRKIKPNQNPLVSYQSFLLSC